MNNKNHKSHRCGESCFLAAISLVLAVAVYVLNIGSAGPMIQADEGSYLANASAIAGYKNDMASSYHAGYSIIISPAFLIASSPSQIWIAVKIINSILYAATIVLLGLIARQLFPGASRRELFLGVVVAGLYPMWVVMVGYSFAQIAFVPFYLLVVYLFLGSMTGGSVAKGLVLGLAAGFLYWIHPTAMPVIIVLMLASLYWSWVNKNYKFMVPIVLGVALALACYKYFFVPWLYERMTVSGELPRLHYPDAAKVFEKILTADGLQRLFAITGGHIFYLAIGSVGLVVIAFVELVKWIAGGAGTSNSRFFYRAASILILGSLIGVLSLSVLAMMGANRLDHWIYGRYVEGVLAPTLLIAVLSAGWIYRFWLLPVAVISALVLLSGLSGYTHTAPFNVSTFWQEFFIRDHGVYAWLAGGLAVAVFLFAWPKLIALVGVVVFFGANIYLQINYHEVNSKSAQERARMAIEVRRNYARGSCVGFDKSGLHEYKNAAFWYDLGFHLYDYKLVRSDVANWRSNCDGPIFSHDKKLHEKYLGVVPVAISPRGGPVLYSRSGEVRQESSALYPVMVSASSAKVLPLLGDGWHDIESSHVWSGKSAELNLPVPEICKSKRCSALVEFGVYGASAARPVEIYIETVVGQDVRKTYMVNVLSGEAVKISLDLHDAPIQVFRIVIPSATSPKELQGRADGRILGISLRSIDLLVEKTTN